MGFKLNRQFRRKYNQVFRRDPAAANLLLLLAELADNRGQVITDEQQLAELMAARFDDCRAYQLPGGPKQCTGDTFVYGASHLMPGGSKIISYGPSGHIA